jgi:hypothetical protein
MNQLVKKTGRDNRDRKWFLEKTTLQELFELPVKNDLDESAGEKDWQR